MAGNGPDPAEFLERAQRVLRELFGEGGGLGGFGSGFGGGGEPWAEATRAGSQRVHREPSPERQKENLTFALATRAVEALEDLALNVAAIRQRMERADGGAQQPRPEADGPGEADLAD